jgi:hypothetical protein
MTYHMASFDKSLSQNSYGPISTQNESADSDGAVLFSQPDAFDQKDYYLHVFSSDRFNFDLTPPASSVYYTHYKIRLWTYYLTTMTNLVTLLLLLLLYYYYYYATSYHHRVGGLEEQKRLCPFLREWV